MTARLWRVFLPSCLLAMLPLGCDATRRDPHTCWEHPCPGANDFCNDQHQCVALAAVDAGLDLRDGAEPDRTPSIDATVDGMAMMLDAALDGVVDVPLVPPADAPRLDTAIDLSVDSASPVDSVDSVDLGDSFAFDGPASCQTSDQCKVDSGAPICSVSHACVSCAAVDAGCPSATPVCEAASGRCLECVGGGDCPRDPGKSFCVGNKCAGCLAAGTGACAARDASKPACSAVGTCVECMTSNDCLATSKPICDTASNVCVPCASDSACAAKTSLVGPGVCMAHQDHRCATDAETIYIQRDVCAYGAPDGSAAHPFCGFDDSASALSPSRKVMVVRGLTSTLQQPLPASLGQVSIVGQNGATLSGIRLVGGSLYVRNVTVSAGADMGISATSGATLQLDHVVVDSCAGGGILLNGAAFDIQNTTVTNNGPGQGTTLWGGILVQSLPSGATARLNLVTLEGNNPTGLWCQAGGIQGYGVLAADNSSGVDIGTSCNITGCSPAGASCGAQP